MHREPQVSRPSPRALEVLLTALEDLATEREDVRSALAEIQTWLGHVLARDPGSGLQDKVLVPAPDRRSRARGSAAAPPSESAAAERRAEVERSVDLSLVARRARWKADAVNHVLERRAASRSAAEAETGTPAVADDSPDPRTRAAKLRERAAELPGCSTWWLDTSRPLPSDEALREISACYRVLARAADVVFELEAIEALDPAPPSDLLYVLAEIQSALLVSLAPTDQRHDDDQRDLFGWLKAQTTRHRIYVDRHMRLDDPAESGLSEVRAARLEELREELLDGHRRRLGRQRLLRKAAYHLQKAGDAGAADEGDRAALEQAAREWCELGLPAGDPALKDLVKTFVGAHGKGPAPGPFLTRVLNADAPGTSAPPPPRTDVLEVLVPLLAGRSALMLAERESHDAGEGLRRALGLERLTWVVLGEGPDVETRIAAELEARDPGLVLLGLRMQPEAYAEFKRLCLERERPFVRLIQGFETTRVAQQILRQVGWRLRSAMVGQRS